MVFRSGHIVRFAQGEKRRTSSTSLVIGMFAVGMFSVAESGETFTDGVWPYLTNLTVPALFTETLESTLSIKRES